MTKDEARKELDDFCDTGFVDSNDRLTVRGSTYIKLRDAFERACVAEAVLSLRKRRKARAELLKARDGK